MAGLWTPDGREQPDDDELAYFDDGDEEHTGGLTSAEERQALADQLAAMQEELAQTPAEVVVANHAVGLFQLATIHLNRRPPNLQDGRLALDAFAALIEGLPGRLGDDEATLKEALSQARLAFVQLASSEAEQA